MSGRSRSPGFNAQHERAGNTAWLQGAASLIGWPHSNGAPGLRRLAVLKTFAKQDPQAARQVMEAKQAYDQLVAQSQNYAQMRQANEALLQHTRAAELARVNRVEGEKAATEFTKYVEARDPQWKSDPDYRQSLQKMAADIVEEVAPGSAAAIQRGEMYITTGQQKAPL